MIITAVVSRALFPILCLLFVAIISQASAQQSFLNYTCSNDRGNYTANSTYDTNLIALLSNLTSNTKTNYGFYNSSYGRNPDDRVYAIGMCRGDVKADECRSCLDDSRVLLTRLCVNQKEAVGWYDNCMLRYSHRSIFGSVDTEPTFYLWNPSDALEVDQFNQVLGSLMDRLRENATAGDYRRKYAASDVSGPRFQHIFGLVQCTPDLSRRQCDGCLVKAVSEIPTCCNNKKGGRVVKPSCNIRYEIYNFFGPTADAPPPSLPPPTPSPNNNNATSSKSTQGKSNTSRTNIVIVVLAVVVVVLVLCVICVCLRARKLRKNSETQGVEDEIIGNEPLQFDFDTMRIATSDFSDHNKLGQGGFGAVYKGMLPNGQMIAVKRLSMDSGQGATEFKNEVLLLVKLQHRNLVRLLGFCFEGRERLLVYEFVSNKSLDYFIFDPNKKGQLDWTRRYKIIEGVARGLLYLHEDSRLRIVHRDLKASNILLDDEMNPKISDFGIAKLFVMDQTQGNTRRIVGTYGYMAPEYAMHGQFSVKSDVYSFGVLVLEIVSGRKNTGILNGEHVDELLSFAWKNWRDGTATNILDPSLSNNSRIEMMRCIHIGLLCVQEDLADRPAMASVVLMLNSNSLTLAVPSEPAYFVDSRTRSLTYMPSRATITSHDSTRILAQESENEASITELYPR